MATSATLTNSDLLQLIFEFFLPPPPSFLQSSPPYRADLAQAARVCVAFYEPAVRVLWRDLPSLLPLLRLLPSLLTKVAGARMDEGELLLDKMPNGTVKLGEWERMREHAGYIRTLSLRDSTFDDIGLATWKYLLHLAQGSPLLPNLRRLHCVLQSPQSITMVFPLLSSNLRSLDLLCEVENDVGEWEGRLRSLFPAVCSIATRLDFIRFEFEIPRRHRVPLPFTIISSIRQLESLRVVRWITPSIVDFNSLQSVFSGMRSLEAIDLKSPSHRVDAMPTEDSILTRQRLKMRGWNLDNLRIVNFDLALPPTVADKVYNCLQAPNLLELCDWSYRVDDVREIVAGLTTISRRFPNLQVLYLMMVFGLLDWGVQMSPETFSLGLIVHPLSKLRAVTTLHLEISKFPDATTDADIHALAEACPLLIMLFISIQPRHLPPAALGPAALVSLATQCPKLKTLHLTSLHIPESDLSHLADFPVLDHPLKTMSYRFFEVADYRYTASLFDRLFPRLDVDQTGYFPRGSESERTWTQVWDEVGVLQAARKQHERSSAADVVSVGVVAPATDIP